MQTRVVQMVEPLALARHSRQEAFRELASLQSLEMTIHGCAAGPPGDPYHQVIRSLQGIAQQPVEEPPIQLLQSRFGLGQHLRCEPGPPSTKSGEAQLAPNPVSFPSFYPEGMLSLPFTAKISRQHREEIPLFFGTCYVILKREKTTRMGNSSSSFR